MESELLVPGVQDGGEADGGLELGAGDLEEGLGDGLEEEGQAHRGCSSEERVKLLGDGEDDLEVRGGQEHPRLPQSPNGMGALSTSASALSSPPSGRSSRPGALRSEPVTRGAGCGNPLPNGAALAGFQGCSVSR